MSGNGCSVAWQLLLSRYELSVHLNHCKSAVVVAFYHHKSIDLLFIINDRFQWWTKGEILDPEDRDYATAANA
jgi:hypothetical protein